MISEKQIPACVASLLEALDICVKTTFVFIWNSISNIIKLEMDVPPACNLQFD